MNNPDKADISACDLNANPMPFDGKRSIFGGFTPLVECESKSRTGRLIVPNVVNLQPQLD